MCEDTQSVEFLGHVSLPVNIRQPDVVTVTVELKPGAAGSPPHRHPGPVFAYVIEGELLLELEGQPERVIKAGEAFWEPGGDVVHWKSANHLADGYTRFVAVVMCPPDREMLTFLEPEEIGRRRRMQAHPSEAAA